MVMGNENSDVFYLGFNRNTGNLVELIPPNGREIILDPKEVLQLDLGESGESKSGVLERLDEVIKLLKTAALPPVTITFADTPGSSICCGSINGIPFRYQC